MDLFHQVIHILSFGLNIVGALIAVYGVVIALVELVRKEIHLPAQAVRLNEQIRVKLGSYLILGLEVFIAGDIVKTILTPTWESLGMLGAIVVIRTVLSYFLAKDLSRQVRAD